MSTRACSALVALVLLAGCGLSLNERVAPIPAAEPIPAPPPEARAATGSIWGSATYRVAFSEDQRARRRGDLLTILLVERVISEKSAAQTSLRQSARSIDLSGFAQTEALERALSQGAESSFNGRGRTQQSNRLSGELTVTVVDVLPNGVLRVAGDRRLVLTRGEEQVQFSGLVRPEDISADNRVLSTRVADARIRYTGTGEVARAAAQGWFHRFFERINPL
ncbi:flagellar basal body L-ring protein FlgH [Thermaurantiacus sp.]